MKNIVILILVICLLSCKKETKTIHYSEEINESNVSVQDKEMFIIKMNVKYLKNDRIWVFYTEDIKQDFFSIETFLSKPVKGKEDPQWIFFKFPLGVFPERIKILFSNNEKQNEIRLNEIQFLKNNKTLKMEGERLANYFNFSKFISTSDGYQFVLKIVDGVYDPNIVSSSQLDTELIKL